MSGYLSFPTFPSVPSMAAETQDFVENLLTDSRAAAADAIDRAYDAIESLRDARPPEELPDPPIPPTINTSFSNAAALSFGAQADFGSLTVELPPDFAPEDIVIPSLEDEIPEYVPLITGLSLPGAPTAASVAMPVPPAIDTTFVIPDAPTPDYGDIPDLLPLDLPTYVPPTLEAFTDEPPEFSALVPSSAIDWAEPAYEAWIADELQGVLQTMLAGGTGIDPLVERAIWERDRGRLDVAARSALEDARDDFAASGFDLPGAALMARTITTRKDNQDKVSQLSRDVSVKQADLEQTNRQFAIKSGTELENIFVQIFMKTTDRSFDIAKFAVEARIQIFNAEVAAFNVEQQLFTARIERYKVGLAYVQAQIESYKARLSAESIKTDINKSLIEAFKAKISAFQAEADAYRALVQAASARADLQKNRVELFRAEIEGVQAVYAAKKSEFDGYAARIQGESAKASLEEANSRAYSARVGAISSVVEIKVKGADLKLAKQKMLLDSHLGNLTRLGQLSAQQLQAIQARIGAYEAITQRDTAKYGANVTKDQLAATEQIEAAKVLVAYYGTQIEVWKGRVQSLLENSKIISESMRTAGQIAGTLAAGAYAGTSVSAAFGGSVSRAENASQSQSFSDTQSESTSTSNNTNTNHNYNHET